jgi:DNA polymerase-1
VEVNPDSHPQVTNLFYGILRFPAYRNQGEVTCDDRALRMLILKGSKEAEILLRYRKLSKMHGTYFEMVFDEDQRLRCSYNPVGTEQGRISSSKNIFGTGGNLQNLPAQMTALQLADPGYIMVNQDLAQAENRVVAYVFGEEKMITAFENGVDIHKQTGALIAGVSLEQVTDDIRQDGKRANHGLNYDLGAESFALYYQLQRDVAKRIVDRYHAVYPGVREGHARIRDQLTRNGRTLVNCQGRYRTFLGRWGHDLFKVAYSFIPQSTVGMKMNTDGVCHLFERQDLYPEVVFLNTVHDSILYQIPLSVGPKRIMEIVLSVKASLESPLMWEGRSFSIPTDTAFGFTNNKKTQLNFKATKIKQTALSALCDELSEFTKVAA